MFRDPRRGDSARFGQHPEGLGRPVTSAQSFENNKNRGTYFSVYANRWTPYTTGTEDQYYPSHHGPRGVRGYNDIGDRHFSRPISRPPPRPGWPPNHNEWGCPENHVQEKSAAFARPPDFGGRPSREVMLDGLAPDMSEQDISSELYRHHRLQNLEDVRVIRDGQTGASRRFGFIRFATVDEAVMFIQSNVELNYLIIYLYGSNKEGKAFPIHLAFSKEREDRHNYKYSAWMCNACCRPNHPGRAQCFRCGAQKAVALTSGLASIQPASYKNMGENDVQTWGPSQFLLFRNLDPAVSEDLLAEGAAKLVRADDATVYTPSKVASTATVEHAGAQPGSLLRVLLIRDKRSRKSWQFGFAEFTTVQDAQAAFANFSGLDKFTIASKSVTVNFIHSGVFKPHQGNPEFTFAAMTAPLLRLAYWDEDAYASELAISATSTVHRAEVRG